MGYYSTPKEAAHHTCERCESRIADESEVATCAVCSDTLCEGCAFECADCEEFYCAEHIVATPAGNFAAAYNCGCEAKQLAEVA